MPEGSIERPLSPSLPRDCGHECRVCKVKVGSLTDYASHISSPTHKQNVETADKQHAGNNHDEDYFDQALVDLIEKRNKQIRKEKEEAAAKLAKEEEERKNKEEFQQRLKEVRERYRLEHVYQPPLQGFSGSSQQRSWHRNNYNVSTEDARPWHHHNKEGKSATWHAQEPPNLQKWASDKFSGGRNDSHVGRGNKTWGYGAYHGNQQSRLPWLSSEGSSYGLYGQNNISRYAQKAQHKSFLGPPLFQASPSFYAQAFNQFQSAGNNKGSQQEAGLQHEVTETDHNSSTNLKTSGSNPKLDKGCRWSPYPVTSGPHSETQPNMPEKHHKAPKPQKHEISVSDRNSQPEHDQGHLISSEEDKVRYQTKPKSNLSHRSYTSTRGNISPTGGSLNSTSGSSSQKPNKTLFHSSVSGTISGAQHNKASSQALPPSKLTGKQSGLKESVRPLQERQERHLPESLNTARQMVSEKKGSLNSSVYNRWKVTHQTEEQQKEQGRKQSEANKETSCGHNSVKPSPPVTYRVEKPARPSSDSSKFVQSLQISTSSTESAEPAASARNHQESRKKVEQKSCSAVPDEAMQVTEAGQTSESDTCRGGEANAASGTNSSTLSKLDLPPVLKRDLTKHMSSKSKTTGHEPNLNIARRVRDRSEARRSDTEKDSGLKPTVRQLISSSGTRRNVNWEQVYQEVRKKQDKGKGIPRFGIEMVPCEQESQSQEEEDIPLLEGFQWESLMDVSVQGTSRKRSLSESILAPASTHSLFASFTSEETAPREGLGSEQLRSTGSPGSISAPEKADRQRQSESKAQKLPDKLTSTAVKVLQRSDSVLCDSSSGAEQNDGQGTGKRRRAARDVPSREASCLEHDSKRRKLKSKRGRLQIDQLLTVSLREEELSRSLQNVDTSLIQARAALEAAYMEVQRLILVKEQITVEMSTLRNQRIELLKGMQGTSEEAPLVKLKEEKMDSCETEPPVMPSSVLDVAISSSNHAAECASPPSSGLPLSVVIKEEPQSPIHVSSELDTVDSVTLCAHSTTPELPVAAATAPDPVCNVQPPPERKLKPFQTNCVEPAERKEKLPAQVEMAERSVKALSNYSGPLPDSKGPIKPPSRRGSEVGSVVDYADNQSVSSPSVCNVLASPSELRSGKRVRKLKKRKVLKKAQGTEQPESSDSEIEEEVARPRWLRQRRRPSGGSQVSTSSQPMDDREVTMDTDGHKKTLSLPLATTNIEEEDQNSPEKTAEHQAPPADPLGNTDLEESMVTAACQQHPSLLPPRPPGLLPDSCRPETQSLACNKVSSTSDIDLCKSSESDLPFAITLPKNSSDAFSDQGGDEILMEGGFEGHQEAVNAIQIHNGLLYTCSGDRTIRAFDLVSHKCVGVFEGHSSKVTCLLVSAAPCLHHRLYSGSSDQTIRCYSLKTQEFEQHFSLSDRVLCLHSRWKTLYAGLANGTVVSFNLRTNKQMDVFECHGPRGVSCLASSQEGAQRILLVGSYDSTISVRAAKNGLLLRTLEGHNKSVLCMTVVNDFVFSGSSDHSVYAHNIHTGELARVYKGHSHGVTVVTVLGKVMVTACLDKLVRVYDLQSQNQLQVYGGHKDMVLCMAVYKNMIYTGCYDGSVQAVKLNLMQNYRCWWHGCSLVFGMSEHLQQHLISHHTGANFQLLKCRWKNCEEFFCARNSSKQLQIMMLHMQKHAEEPTEVEP
ncbi:zinc finger protein 106 isoform X2 [Kryptolebias marmoratus]|uniref:zinc finger protein 106 isoform X2 n=1 Tax=Kryptolebias marmoratus TaxID=37003 RepID=UPI0007F90945|nr:zinc finger protein 106 isoform X2 [Kryptolebias marmoratus]